jgi:membrane protein DedA with SNARE-associated domain
MPDHRTQLQQLLDHPQADAELPAAPAFTEAVMARLHGDARYASKRFHLLPWCVALCLLAAAFLVPGSWLGDELDPSVLLDDAPALDTVVEIIIASVAAGVLLFGRRRSLA